VEIDDVDLVRTKNPETARINITTITATTEIARLMAYLEKANTSSKILGFLFKTSRNRRCVAK
jgi:hypothetical protein